MNGKERRKEGRKEEVRKWKKKHKRNNFQLKFEIDLSSVMDVLNGKTNSICVQVWVVNKSACLSLSFSFFLSFIFPYLNSLYSVLLLDTSCISRNSTWQENSVCILWWKKKNLLSFYSLCRSASLSWRDRKTWYKIRSHASCSEPHYS